MGFQRRADARAPVWGFPSRKLSAGPSGGNQPLGWLCHTLSPGSCFKTQSWDTTAHNPSEIWSITGFDFLGQRLTVDIPLGMSPEVPVLRAGHQGGAECGGNQRC